MTESQLAPARRYRMGARAEATEANGVRILAAARELFGDQLYDQVSLDEVAARARVTVRTVVRRFGSKDQLFAAVTEERGLRIRRSRDETVAGDLPGGVRGLIDSYEEWGDVVLHMLAQERRIPAIGAVVESGRRYHQAWVERAFSPLVGDLPPALRARRLAQLTAVTDVYAWKVLRRDLGLTRDEVEATLRDLVTRIVSPGREMT
ncbi:MAG: hypothetical protein NVS9B1_22030 [Candidatus Dormibacteraceae bacterium]